MTKSTKPAAKKVSKPAVNAPLVTKAAKTVSEAVQPVQAAKSDLEAVKPVETTVEPIAETVKAVPKTPYQVQAGSKMAEAIRVFNEMQGQPRKDVLARFVSEVGLTVKGAPTYYSMLVQRKRKNQI